MTKSSSDGPSIVLRARAFLQKLVAAVPQGSEQIVDETLKQGRAQWRKDQNRAICMPFMDAAVEFVAKEPRSGGKLKGFLLGLPGDFEDAVSRAFGASKAPIREFLDTFAAKFTWNKSLTKISVKAGTTQPRRRLRGKLATVPTRSEPSAPPSRTSKTRSYSLQACQGRDSQEIENA